MKHSLTYIKEQRVPLICAAGIVLNVWDLFNYLTHQSPNDLEENNVHEFLKNVEKHYTLLQNVSLVHNSGSEEVFLCVYNLTDIQQLETFLGDLFDPTKVVQQYHQNWSRIKMNHPTHGFTYINFV